MNENEKKLSDVKELMEGVNINELDWPDSVDLLFRIKEAVDGKPISTPSREMHNRRSE